LLLKNTLKIFLHLKAITQHNISNEEKYLSHDLAAQKSEENSIAYTMTMNGNNEMF
jgi:hypothetical protein